MENSNPGRSEVSCIHMSMSMSEFLSSCPKTSETVESILQRLRE